MIKIPTRRENDRPNQRGMEKDPSGMDEDDT
jgi:hypothetical protein